MSTTPGQSETPLADDGSELRCPACDYDLRALHSDRCPECGLLLDRAGTSVSQIPWAHRREMGRLRAFRKTCWMMFRRPKRIAADAARPVSFDDAKRFQRAVILVMYLPLLAFGLWVLLANVDERPFRRPRFGSYRNGLLALLPPRLQVAPPGQRLGWILEGLGVVFAAICLWLFLNAATGVASYFFHPRGLPIPRQNRAIALSYYACAPLAWTPISIAVCVSLFGFSQSRWAGGSHGWQAMGLLSVAAFVSVAVQLVAWLRCILVLLRQTTRCSKIRVLTAGVSLPFLWAIGGALMLGVLPAAYLFVCLVILSLQ